MTIALEEGLSINARKTRTMSSSQRQTAAGIILNKGINGRRREYDTLKAILYNCKRHGPRSQNHANHPHFAEHLAGRIHWLSSLNSGWGAKLQLTFEDIDWTQ